MPYKKKRPYKKEYEQQKNAANMQIAWNANALVAMDKKGVDKNKNGQAGKREGKDIAHKKPLSKGGTNKDGYRVQSRKKNRAAGGAMSSPKKKK